MISYMDKTFCTARCDNYDCHRMIRYSQTRHAERLDLPIAFSDLSSNCEDYSPIPVCCEGGDVGIGCYHDHCTGPVYE